MCVFFFFSSRRRHTRLQGDWSSDVCSSDLLTGTTTVAAVSGVATFPGLSINKVGSAYTLTAGAAGLTQTSAAFNVTPGAATQLAFTVPPSNAIEIGRAHV